MLQLGPHSNQLRKPHRKNPKDQNFASLSFGRVQDRLAEGDVQFTMKVESDIPLACEYIVMALCQIEQQCGHSDSGRVGAGKTMTEN
jgi:hypothetical protein